MFDVEFINQELYMKRIAESNREIVIYGCGEKSNQGIIDLLSKWNIDFTCWIDKKWGVYTMEEKYCRLLILLMT